MPTTGTLYLIPTPINSTVILEFLPAQVPSIARTLEYFIAEEAKSARRFLKSLGMARPIAELHISILNEHTKSQEIPSLLDPLRAGFDAGLLSEAGCPCVADPGSPLVRFAHQEQIRVKPLIGPSSILLALMASGLNGQSFTFHGYVPLEDRDRKAFLLKVEAESRQSGQTQIFMDTPYRTDKLFHEVIATCSNNTLFCLAKSITEANESIITKGVGEWKRANIRLAKEAAIFLLLGQ